MGVTNWNIYNTAAPAANSLETKILLNSVISGRKDGARFMTIDIKDFFLQSILNGKRIYENSFKLLFGVIYSIV